MPGWHILEKGQSKGPYSDSELKVLFETGVVNASTLCWKSGYPDWKPLAEADFVYRSLLDSPLLPQAAQGDRQPNEDLSIWGYYVRSITKKYARFGGRAHRKEYWGTVFFYLIFLLLISGASPYVRTALGSHKNLAILYIVLGFFYIFGMIIPMLAVLVRRFHDVGSSGWLVLSGFIPYLGALYILVITLMPPQSGPNKHGPNTSAQNI